MDIAKAKLRPAGGGAVGLSSLLGGIELENVRACFEEDVSTKTSKREGRRGLHDRGVHCVVVGCANHNDADSCSCQSAERADEQTDRPKNLACSDEVPEPARQPQFGEAAMDVRHSSKLGYATCPDVERY